jgi:hypothetical protein
VDWVVVSGRDAPLHPAHVRRIRDSCADAGVPFTFRGWGAWQPLSEGGISIGGERFPLGTPFGYGLLFARVGAARSGALLDGREHDGRPEALR